MLMDFCTTPLQRSNSMLSVSITFADLLRLNDSDGYDLFQRWLLQYFRYEEDYAIADFKSSEILAVLGQYLVEREATRTLGAALIMPSNKHSNQVFDHITSLFSEMHSLNILQSKEKKARQNRDRDRRRHLSLGSMKPTVPLKVYGKTCKDQRLHHTASSVFPKLTAGLASFDITNYQQFKVVLSL